MKKVSESVKAELLDQAPNFKNFSSDKIVAASGIVTMRKKNFMEMLENVDEKVLKGFHNEATRRGHASLITSVNFYFWLEGSRVIDFYFSSFPFGSYNVFSSRRIEVGIDDIIVPDSIANSKFKDEYEKICNKMIELYNKIKQETSIDNARRILPIGFVSRMYCNLPLQVILGIIKEIREDDKKSIRSLPKEIGQIANILEDVIKKHTTYLADASLRLSYNTNFPHPNLFVSDMEFKNPETKILLKDNNFEKILTETKNKLSAEMESTPRNKENVIKTAEIWKELVEKVQDKILVNANIIGSLSIWNDIKRHRTIRQKVESIYHAVERCSEKWNGNTFYIPQTENAELRNKCIDAYKIALEFYKKMIENGIEKRDAIYVIPHGINLDMNLFLNGYHIFDPFGFFGVRTCTTTDHEIISIANKIIADLKKGAPEISNEIETLVGPKCKLGYCPERTFCGVVKKFVKNYDENMHANFQ